MNLEEFIKALSSDATEENAQLKRQLSDIQTECHEKLSKLENENDSLKESCRVLCNRCFTLTRGVTCLFCGLDYPCPHMPGLEEQVAMAHKLRKENPMSQKYDEYLEKHRQAVKKAYQWIAAYIPELTDVEATRNIEFHDMSKNTPDEYTPYDNYFYGEQTPNPHHWQYWVLINDEPKEGTILIEMPYPYIIEMICDWWAFSWIKGDLSEMFAWYKDHADYIKMHNNTRSIVEEILEMIRTRLTEVENAEN